MIARTATTDAISTDGPATAPAPRLRANRELMPAIPLLLPAVLIYGAFTLLPIVLTQIPPRNVHRILSPKRSPRQLSAATLRRSSATRRSPCAVISSRAPARRR